ncbi:hypothetical protein GMST_37520 [Geomonas silvestris]|uniref:Flagellar hook-length control protein-like C-terminal domain-containing protein n=1 Tax=Geomonas silvestris TaxID=2740184 RepID=A0A6V8MNI1_9BACT|nr:flagellar hook-length control protein FliK [Geomonas silvestris]GFO61427.1 hypothetical protein GMST_37520 [Geomonas silvestris]
MLINDQVQRQVLPVLARSTVAPPVEVQQRAGSHLQLNPGQQVKAEILATLPNNLYLARVAGELFKLEIPLNVQPGETLEMTFVSADPKVTFNVLRPEVGSSVSLSSLGKWLAGVVNEAPALPLLQGTLLDEPPHGTALLGERLKEALTQGGLFYEAHLAQWAAGGLPLGELLKEPQGKLSRRLKGAEEGDPDLDGAEIADGRTLPFIKEQLHLLNNGVLAWRGEAWPGQEMELAVTLHDEAAGEREVESNLVLTLPQLGRVAATLRLTPQGVQLQLVCDQPGSAGILKGGVGELREALWARGLSLTQMVAKDAETA